MKSAEHWLGIMYDAPAFADELKIVKEIQEDARKDLLERIKELEKFNRADEGKGMGSL